MLRSGAMLPSLEGATGWINPEPAPDELRGRPVLVQFWALSCYLCKENTAVLRDWKARFGPRGVAFVSVHMPRQESDLDEAAVEATARAEGMDEPLAIDGAHAIGDRFETGGLWPAYFLFDAGGHLRSRAAGAAGLSVMEGAIERLLQEAA